MKDFILSYDKDTSYINNITVSPDIKIMILYTHFMENSKNIWNFETHTHSFNELHIVLGGKCRMNLGNKDIFLTENEYILVPAETEHCFLECSDDFFRFSMAFDVLYDKKQALIPKSSVLSLDKECVSYIEVVLNEYEENKIGCKNIIDSMFCCLIIEVLRKADVFSSAEAVVNINSDFCEALQFIDNNISNKITTADVANKVFLSIRHLNRIFSANLNMTVSQYIKTKKMNNIKEYLRKTDLNIKEIAHLNGFDNESSFCKFFKKETGIPPSQYRLSSK